MDSLYNLAIGKEEKEANMMEPKFVALPDAQGVNLALITRWDAGPQPGRTVVRTLEIYFAGEPTPVHYTGDAAARLLNVLNGLAQPDMLETVVSDEGDIH